MIDEKAVAAGIAAMKEWLVEECDLGRIQMIGSYKAGAVQVLPHSFEIEGAIDMAALATAFMRGAGIDPPSEVQMLRLEVESMRKEFIDFRMSMLPRQPGDAPFRTLAPRVTVKDGS